MVRQKQLRFLTQASAVIIVCMAGCSRESDDRHIEPGRQLAVSQILASSGCNGDVLIQEKVNRVLPDSAAYESEFAGSDQKKMTPPIVDFSRFAVIAVHGGPQSACNTSLAVKAAEMDEEVLIDVTLTEGCGGDDALAYPYIFSMVPKVAKPYRFVEHKVTAPCN
jgi:hypothetical protein